MQPAFDVIVIGVGSMGAATCWELARRGVRVLGLEQFGIPNALGSHHGHSRMIRLAYFEHPDYVPLLQRAYESWRELEVKSREKILHITGGLYMGPPDSKLVAGAKQACVAHDLSHKMFSETELRRRFPQFEPPSGYHGLYEEEAGFLRPELAVSTMANLAERAGAKLHQNEAVNSWQETMGGVSVTTDRETYHAEKIVFAGGAWNSHLLAEQLPVELKVTRQPIAWFEPAAPQKFKLGRLPIWYMETTDGHGHYGLPMHDDRLGLKVALHHPGANVNPNEVSREFNPRDAAELQEFLANHLPDADGRLLHGCVCLYTYSPDSHFIVDRLPNSKRAFIAGGFSGHGFKFATVVGEIMADYVTTGETSLPAEFLRLKRFHSQKQNAE